MDDVRRPLPVAARIVLAGSAVNALGTGLVLPFLLIYLHQVRGVPLGTTGLLLALPGLVGFLAGPLGGLAADRAGAQRVLVGGVLASAAANVLLAGVHTAAQAAPVWCCSASATPPSSRVRAGSSRGWPTGPRCNACSP